MSNTLLNELSTSFKKIYLQICESGYSILGRTPPTIAPEARIWHFDPSYPPSYRAQAKHRFLKTLEVARAINATSILEVAAGGGFNGICLYENGKRVVLNDMRFLEQEIKQWPNSDKIETKSGNLFDLKPEEMGKFDLVLACEVIEHVAHGEDFVRHLKKFLNPGGKLMITTPNGAYFRSKLPTYSQIRDFSELESKQFQPDADGHLYLYTQEELEKVLRSAGFTQISSNLSVTPWLSGNGGFRFFLPTLKLFAPIYYELDRVFTKHLGTSIARKFCTQMITVAS